MPTASALRFVGAPTWEALSGKPVSTEVWTSVHEVPHVRIGQGADLVVGEIFGVERAARRTAASYPKVAFLMGSSFGPVRPNLSVFDNFIHEPSYLTGMVAGRMTRSNLVGMVGAGKSTLMTLLAVWAHQNGLRITLVVGDVAEQLTLTELFRTLGLSAALVQGDTTRPQHTQRLPSLLLVHQVRERGPGPSAGERRPEDDRRQARLGSAGQFQAPQGLCPLRRRPLDP